MPSPNQCPASEQAANIFVLAVLRTRLFAGPDQSRGSRKQIMEHLSYADRELLLQTLESFKAEAERDCSETNILQSVFELVKSLSPTYGFEHALIRDLTVLSRYLETHKDYADIAEIARGALLYVVRAKLANAVQLHAFRLIDDAFVCNFAVHEIRTRLGDTQRYSPPQLAPDEMARAEHLFLELLSPRHLIESDLISAVESRLESWGSIHAANLFRRLRRNIEFLIAVLRDNTKDEEHRSYARGALSYLVCEDDIIDDRLGLVGLIDDCFVVQLAVDFIEPNREPWQDLLDATVAAWPFLNNLFLNDGTEVTLPSEYMIISSALSCDEVRKGSRSNSAVMISPAIGPTPFLVGLLATIGLTHSTAKGEPSSTEFRIGQKVLVDHSAVAVFAGFDTSNGRQMFKLKQFRTDRGQRHLETIRSWPISDLGRLTVAIPSRAIRGSVEYDRKTSDEALPGLEYLLGKTAVAALSSIHKRIVVVTQIASAFELAKRLTLNGWSLRDVVPMGHLTEEGDVVRPWTSRFGTQEPILVFASDLDAAARIVEFEPARYGLMVVEATARNAENQASFRRLRRLNVPTVVMATDRTSEHIDCTDSDVWDWTRADFDALVWPKNEGRPKTGTIATFERQLKDRSTAKVVVINVSSSAGNEAIQAQRRIQRLAQQRGSETLVELDEVVSKGFWIVSHLLKTATPLNAGLPSFESLAMQVRRLDEIRCRSKYLSQEERTSLQELQDRISDLFNSLTKENPKAIRLSAMLDELDHPAIICPDSRLIKDLQHVYSKRASSIVASCQSDATFPSGAVVPGWFSRSRMSSLLVPPVANPLTLLLYEIEASWYAGFDAERHKARHSRSGNSNRSTIFPGLKGWSASSALVLNDGVSYTETQENEDGQERILTLDRSRFYRRNAPNGTETAVNARFVVFGRTSSYENTTMVQCLADRMGKIWKTF